MSGGNAVSGEDDKAAAGKGMGAMGILVSGQGANKRHAVRLHAALSMSFRGTCIFLPLVPFLSLMICKSTVPAG
jgi:hypothetical protein